MIKNEVLEKVCSKILKKNEFVLKTGFSDLDEVLRGIDKSSLITIGARPAMGKTCFMTNIMLNLLEQNRKCLFFSLEMGEEQFLKRLIGQITEIDSYFFNNASEITKNEKYVEKIKNASDKILNCDLTVYDEISDISKINEQIELEKPEFVFIDDLQSIKASIRKSRIEQIDDIMRNLKNIAKENNCIIFLTSQLSRSVENRYDKRPMLCDLRDSGSIENFSDVVIFIYRDEYYNGSEDDFYGLNKGKADIIVAKNKYGPVCSMQLLFRSSVLKFLEPVKNELF